MSFSSGISWSYTWHRQGFWPRINCSKMKLPDFESPSGDSLSKSATFGLSMSKIIEEYQSRHTFFVKSIFADFNFKTTLLLKWRPIFDEPSLDGAPKFGNFIWLQLILGQKPCVCQVPHHKIPLPKLIYWRTQSR